MSTASRRRNAREIGAGVEVLTRSNRDLEGLHERGTPLHIIRRDRLLPPVEVQLLEGASPPDGLHSRQRLVGLDHDAHVQANGLAHDLDPPDVRL
jgi:hypothetical protein